MGLQFGGEHFLVIVSACRLYYRYSACVWRSICSSLVYTSKSGALILADEGVKMCASIKVHRSRLRLSVIAISFLVPLFT